MLRILLRLLGIKARGISVYRKPISVVSKFSYFLGYFFLMREFVLYGIQCTCTESFTENSSAVFEN